GWEEDDGVNQEVAEYFQTELYQLPAFLTGGNIMTDGYGTAFSTTQMFAENDDMLTENQFRQLAYDYCGIADYHLLSNTEDYGIQHIDCAAKLLDEERILVKSLPGWHPEYERMENLVTELSQLTSCFGRPYQIFRIFCASYDGNSVAAYTNSLILNNKVFVPLFDIASDTAALETYQNLMPGHTVIGIPYSLWYYYDALHCRTRAIFDRFMLRMEHRPLDQEISADEELRFDVKITDHSETGLIYDQLWLKWRFAQSPDWLETSLAETDIPDVYSCTLAPLPVGTEIEYYLTAADNSGREEKLPGTAPLSFYSFQISDVSSEGQTITPSFSFLGNYPNPFNPSSAGRTPSTTFSFLLTSPETVSLDIYNLRGQLVTTLTNDYYSAGRHNVNWNPQHLPSGIYLYRIQCGNNHIQGKSILLK
ncbi:MAG: agmatine deiminase family protein, partial [Candidatus Cloacimonetes bacterium]|nr:agmatine deiminase family protein [Candidatus Cloacimonadota bacterium]